MRTFFFVAIACVCVLQNSAQIKGRILEVNSKNDTSAVVDAILFWKNTQIVTTTNSKGFFSINSISTEKQLIVNAMGYKSETILISDTSKLDNFWNDLKKGLGVSFEI